MQQQRVALALDAERARATVNLIRAVGGGWGEDGDGKLASNEAR